MNRKFLLALALILFLPKVFAGHLECGYMDIDNFYVQGTRSSF